MELEDLKTWEDLENYLFDRIDYATNDISKSNSSFTKEKVWNSLVDQCIKWKGQELPIRTKYLLIKRVRKDFGMAV